MENSSVEAVRQKVYQETGESFSAEDILRYTQKVGITPEELRKMSSREIVRAIYRGMDVVYKVK